MHAMDVQEHDVSGSSISNLQPTTTTGGYVLRFNNYQAILLTAVHPELCLMPDTLSEHFRNLSLTARQGFTEPLFHEAYLCLTGHETVIQALAIQLFNTPYFRQSCLINPHRYTMPVDMMQVISC